MNGETTKEKILVILTGGTICSSENEKGERSSQVNKAQYKITSAFRQSKSPYSCVPFDYRTPLNILSENMTLDTWNVLLDEFRSIGTAEEYKGIILLHGTDTLAYTSSLLSLMLTHLDVPVILVSSQLPLDKEGTNGNANFKAAAELIMNGIKPDVYAVYKNSDGNIYLHKGAHLRQCDNYSNDFFSHSMKKIENTENARCDGFGFTAKNDLLSRVKALDKKVLYIAPFVGIDYSSYSLEKIRAVVHGTYHSESVCVERSARTGAVSDFSVISFAKSCKKKGIDLFLAPCNKDAYCYESTGDALENGALPLSSMTREMSYVKVLVGCSLGLAGKALCDFANTDINGERVM